MYAVDHLVDVARAGGLAEAPRGFLKTPPRSEGTDAGASGVQVDCSLMRSRSPA